MDRHRICTGEFLNRTTKQSLRMAKFTNSQFHSDRDGCFAPWSRILSLPLVTPVHAPICVHSAVQV